MVLDETHMGLNYQEDSALSNLKLVVGFAGVGASLVSHVYPAPFPKNWFVLLLCCAWCALPPDVLAQARRWLSTPCFVGQVLPHERHPAADPLLLRT